MQTAVEIVQFKTIPGVERDEFIRIVNDLEKDFHFQQAGFLDTELFYDEESCGWTIIQHWESMAEMKTASEKMFRQAEAESFVKVLDPESVIMVMLPQIQKWGV